MHATRRKRKSKVDNLIVPNATIENQRENKSKAHLFFADAKNCLDKLWMKDCLTKIYHLEYNPATIRSLCEISKTWSIVVDTPVGKTSSIAVELL